MWDGRWVIPLILVLVGLGLYAGALWAQSENGTLVGTVSDASGAAVPNASVTIRNNETGATVTVLADSQGYYTSPPLRPASYTVSAEMTGFRRTVQTIRLDVNQHIRVNFELAGEASLDHSSQT